MCCGDEDELGVGAVEQREQVRAERLLAAAAGVAGAAGRGVGSDDPPPGRDVDPAELVPERARRRPEQHRVTAPERLQVGAVGERDLDLHEHVALGDRLGTGYVLEPQVAGPVEDEPSRCSVGPEAGSRRQRRGVYGFSRTPGPPHGTSTTFSAAPSRNSRSASPNRSSGSTVGSGTSSPGSSATASPMNAGVADREPTTVSSRR